MGQSQPAGRNPLRRNCNGCVATDKWVLRKDARTNKILKEIGGGPLPDGQEKPKLFKEELKAKSEEEKKDWYKNEKRKREQEDKNSKRTFADSTGTLEQTKEKQNLKDPILWPGYQKH